MEQTVIRLLCVVALLGLSILTAACYSGPEFAIKDKREIQGEKRIESFRRNNRTGTTPLVEDVQISKEFSRAIELKLDPSSRLDEIKVRRKIYESYKVQEVALKTCVIPVEVPAGQSYLYGVEWIDILREGAIEEGASGGGKQLGTYRIKMNMLCQVVEVGDDGSTESVLTTPAVLSISSGTPFVLTPTLFPSPTTPKPPSTGHLKFEYPISIAVDDSTTVTAEVTLNIPPPALDSHPGSSGGTVSIETNTRIGQRVMVEYEIKVYPIMFAELIAPSFQITRGELESRRSLTEVQKASWTWNITAKKPGLQTITVEVYGVVGENKVSNLEKSITRNIEVRDRSLMEKVTDWLASNLGLILGTSGPIGLIIAYLALRQSHARGKAKAR